LVTTRIRISGSFLGELWTSGKNTDYWSLGIMRLESAEEPGPEWDAFVAATPGGALGHASAWAYILREAYGLVPHYLAVRDTDGALAGVLPLVRFRTLRGRRELISLPFLDTGGVLARNEAAEGILLAGARDLAREIGATAVELRQLAPLRSAPQTPLQSRVDLVMRLESCEEAQWKMLGAKVRNQTRKAQSGLAPATGNTAERVAGFYAPFTVNMRDLGSPVHAQRFYEVTARVFADRLSVHLAMLNDRPVGGLIAIDFAGTVTVPWASTLRAERARCPNNLIYWEAIRWAIARGAHWFDFGRSPRESGTHRFKLGWGASERELAWVRLGSDGAPTPLRGSASPSLERLARAWTRLPVALATALGARLRPYLAN
jgi:FemAB-related protein (PEP-CTERM system-associated)